MPASSNDVGWASFRILYIFYLNLLSLYIIPILLCVTRAQLIFILEVYEFAWGYLGYECQLRWYISLVVCLDISIN